MALDVEAVAAVVFVLGVPEMVETGTKHMGQGREGADVAAQVAAVFGVVAVGLDDHGHGVPAHVGAQALFDLDVAGTTRLFGGLNRVDVTGRGRKRQVDAVLTRFFQQLFQQEVGTLSAHPLDHGGQGIFPFSGFLGIHIVGDVL